ncbi:mitochondrial import inner membrane translocase subunit TIM14-like [Ruditapes philippinarum]|uniref:mitochondrial import inner membrane translocase subunit TIM14-like n=1 Tax=Ruditapes philippinarum TaxID=129788 RepID=UPI00295BDBC3|nr:mitochondrial import inner membrane translocase subunit TIM14-like [Ruditapes philippinarum]XP_060592946.1 mitochondrial import inner membrane translocase subunit TIM14-like [Ruditapes philippinarum]
MPGTGLILAGLGLAAIGYGGRFLKRYAKNAENLYKKVETLQSGALSGYYRGGFEQKMTKREACLILGVSPSSSQAKIKQAHKRIMLLNHPDRGGSPLIATKINEAKDYLESKKP